jgi:sulfatase maturation enzyme AslB (radical SAM superfamily)
LDQIRGNEEKKASYHYQMLRAGAWPRENQTFWQEIDQVSDQLRYIEFTGGEPFMIQEHFDMLQGLVDRGIAGNIEIHYNTNGTQWPENAMDIWQHFKIVEIALSIDDVESRFEYQRTNAVWSEVLENVSRFRQLRAQHANVRLQVCTTVNIFNVYYLEHVANWIQQQNFDFVYWNMMHDAWYFSIATLPDHVKEQCVTHLKQASVPAQYRDEFDRICDFMKNGASTDGSILKMKIRDLDRRRGQNMKDVAPEFADLLGYDYAQT